MSSPNSHSSAHTSTVSTTTTVTAAAASPESYRFPDLFALCPWRNPINPHHDAVLAASKQLTLGYIVDERRREHFKKGYTERLASWSCPHTSAEKLRVCCDLINLIYVFDECSDIQRADSVQTATETVLHTSSRTPRRTTAPSSDA